MTRFAVGQFVLAFVLVAAGTVKGVRLLVDAFDDLVTMRSLP